MKIVIYINLQSDLSTNIISNKAPLKNVITFHHECEKTFW